MIELPHEEEYNPYFERYINLVNGDPLNSLGESSKLFLNWMSTCPAEKEDIGYAPNKWSPKSLIQHLVDTERIFNYRALCIARAETSELPGFNENNYAKTVNTSAKSVGEIIIELELQRTNTKILFESFTRSELHQIGTVSGSKISVRAIAYILAGHDIHHFNVLKERY